MSFFWRVLLIHLACSFILALLLANTPINSDMRLIKYKPTINFVSFALILWLSIYLSKHGLLYFAWGRRLGLQVASWRKFTGMLSCLMIPLGVANVLASNFLNLEQWIKFKLSVPWIAEMFFCLVAPRKINAETAY